MNRAYRDAIDGLPELSEAGCREYAERLIRMFASFTNAVDECVEPATVTKVIVRWKDLMGRKD